MAEAGPSTGNGNPSSSAASASRHTRLAFPDLDRDAGPLRVGRRADTGTKIAGSSRIGPSKNAASTDGRRRVKSVDEAQQPFSIGLRQAYDMDDSQRRAVSTGRKGGSMRVGKATPGMNTDGSTDYSSAAFSDEYDLCKWQDTSTD